MCLIRTLFLLLAPSWLGSLLGPQSAKSAPFQSGQSLTAALKSHLFQSIQMDHMGHFQMTLHSLEILPEAFHFPPPCWLYDTLWIGWGEKCGMPPGRELDY